MYDLGYCVRGTCKTWQLSCTCPVLYLYIICVLQMCVTLDTVLEDRVGRRHFPVLVPTVIRAIDVRVGKVTTSQDFACLVCYKHMI